MDRHSKGSAGESLAEKLLTEKGFKLVERNYRYGRGEIDLIFYDRDILVFIEVRSVSSDMYGEPEDTISIRKRKQIKKIAGAYLWEKEINDVECRFDVVAIKWENNKPLIKYIPNAF